VSTISQSTQLPTEVLLASYQVAHRFAKSKKSQTISEKLPLPAAIDLVRAMTEGASFKLPHLLPLQEKENKIDLACDGSLKKKF